MARDMKMAGRVRFRSIVGPIGRGTQVAVAGIALVLSACSGSSEVDPARAATPCGRLAAHLVDLELAPAAERLAPRDLEEHRATLLNVAKRDFLPNCPDQVSTRDLECQLAATTLDAARACLEAAR